MSRLVDRMKANGVRPWKFTDWPSGRISEADWERPSDFIPAEWAIAERVHRDPSLHHLLPKATGSFDTSLLNETPVVVADQASNYIDHVACDVTWEDLVGSCTAPFDRMFIEFKLNATGVARTGLYSYGCYIEQDEFPDGFWDDREPNQRFIGGQPRWGMRITPIMETRKGDPFGPIATQVVFLGSDGTLMRAPLPCSPESHAEEMSEALGYTIEPNEVVNGLAGRLEWHDHEPRWLDNPDDVDPAPAEMAAWHLVLRALFTLSLMHSRNVKLEPIEPPERLSRSHRKRHGQPLTRHSRIRIDPFTEILESEGRVSEDGIGKALHRCRGHFKQYGPEAKLFGKYTGQWWWREHRRGDAQLGEVRSDFQVEGFELGVEYREADESPNCTFPAIGETPGQATSEHNQLQNALAAWLRSEGADVRSPGPNEPKFDLLAVIPEGTWVVEVKSLTETNEETQMRAALAQAIRYRHKLVERLPRIRAAVCVPRPLTDETWIELLAIEGIALVWPGRFQELLSGDAFS